MPKITLLPGLTDEQIEDRRSKKFLALNAEEKIEAFFALIELSLSTRQGPIPPRAKLTLKNKNHS